MKKENSNYKIKKIVIEFLENIEEYDFEVQSAWNFLVINEVWNHITFSIFIFISIPIFQKIEDEFSTDFLQLSKLPKSRLDKWKNK